VLKFNYEDCQTSTVVVLITENRALKEVAHNFAAASQSRDLKVMHPKDMFGRWWGAPASSFKCRHAASPHEPPAAIKNSIWTVQRPLCRRLETIFALPLSLLTKFEARVELLLVQFEVKVPSSAILGHGV